MFLLIHEIPHQVRDDVKRKSLHVIPGLTRNLVFIIQNYKYTMNIIIFAKINLIQTFEVARPKVSSFPEERDLGIG